MQEKITTVCIPAYNDTETVHTALEELVNNLNKNNRKPRVMVIDDCSEEKFTEINRNTVKDYRSKYSGDIEFIDREDRRKYAINLAKEKDLPEDVMIFAFCGDKNSAYTVGSSQNYLLSRTRGEKILSIDYDTIYKFFKPEERQPTFDTENPFECWFMEKEEALPNSFSPVEIDILSLHENKLGLKAFDILGNFVPDYAKEYRIIDTFMGLYGDSPMESNTPLLFLPQVFEKFKNIEKEAYEKIKNTRKIVWSPISPSIYQGVMCICTVMGIDNRSLTPPFMSNGRGHELVYGTIRWKAFQDKVSYFSPVIIGHERPRGSRKVGNDSVYELTKMDRVIASIISQINIDSTDYTINLNKIGKTLVDISEQPIGLFELDMQNYCFKILKSIGRYTKNLADTNSSISSFWREDMYNLSKNTENPDTKYFMNDITKEKTGNEMEIFRKWLNMYGKLLMIWHKI